MRVITLLFVLVFSPMVWAVNLNMDILLGRKVVQLGFGDSSSSKLLWGVDMYYNTDDSAGATVYLGSSFIDDQQSPWIFSASVMGHAFHIADFEDSSNYALSLGGNVGYKFLTSVPTALLFELQYAPNVVVSGALERLWMFDTSYQIMLSEASIFSLGYVYYHADFDGDKSLQGGMAGGYDLFNSLYFNLKFRF